MLKKKYKTILTDLCLLNLIEWTNPLDQNLQLKKFSLNIYLRKVRSMEKSKTNN